MYLKQISISEVLFGSKLAGFVTDLGLLSESYDEYVCKVPPILQKENGYFILTINAFFD